jgi:hypothetical protein
MQACSKRCGLESPFPEHAAADLLPGWLQVPALWMSMMSTRIQEVFSLAAWYNDVLKRYEQLAAWTAGKLVTPASVWLSGLFNPKAFLTAVSSIVVFVNAVCQLHAHDDNLAVHELLRTSADMGVTPAVGAFICICTAAMLYVVHRNISLSACATLHVLCCR